MIETDGIVERIEGGDAWVRAAAPAPACGSCASRGRCALPTEAAGATGRLLRLPNPIQARPGDSVVITAADGSVWRAAWRAYALPLLLGLASAGLASRWTGNDGWMFAGLLLGLVAGFAWLRWPRAAEPIFSMRFKHTLSFHDKGPSTC